MSGWYLGQWGPLIHPLVARWQQLDAWLECLARDILCRYHISYSSWITSRAKVLVQAYFQTRHAIMDQFPSYCAMAILLGITEHTSLLPNLPPEYPCFLLQPSHLTRIWYQLLLARHPPFGGLLSKQALVHQSSTGVQVWMVKYQGVWLAEKRFPWDRRWYLVRECQALRHLTHPSIIPYAGYRMHASGVGVVVGYSAHTMLDAIRLRQLGSQWTEFQWQWLLELLAALAAAHTKGVAHRDIKPDNILITNQGGLWLADWDRSIRLTTPEQLRTQFGSVCTPAYCAPEVFGAHDYNPFALDVWSFGVVAVELLMGEGVRGRSVAECQHHMQLIVNGHPPARWPSAVASIAEGCFRPAERRLSAQQMYERVQALGEEVSVDAQVGTWRDFALRFKMDKL